uniref:Queuine tRNA-ribosyltransferase accessory subunit 2 n=1 Tax=Jaculus jaculus TaxID=51337 RepID=A0A8C5JW76_JACJA
MKLSLTKVVNGCRLGKIQNLGKAEDRTMDIPGCLLYTRTGSAPHLTDHTLHKVQGVPAMAQLTLSSWAEHHEVLAEYKKGIGNFIGMPDSLFYCSLHDPVSPCPAGYVTNKSVSVWGVGGRVEMTVSKFMAIQHALQPDWFQCLSDGEASCEETTSRKRARKAVDRSLLFLDNCLRLQEESEVRLPTNCPLVLKLSLSFTAQYCSFCLILFQDFFLLVFLSVLQQNGIQEEVKYVDQIKKIKTTDCNQEMTSFEINLKEKKYQEDFNPLVRGCSCYCCQSHTRAYVHHLLVTNELLAGVLLMMHNFEHYFGFFCSIREALKRDTLVQLKELILRQAS